MKKSQFSVLKRKATIAGARRKLYEHIQASSFNCALDSKRLIVHVRAESLHLNSQCWFFFVSLHFWSPKRDQQTAEYHNFLNFWEISEKKDDTSDDLEMKQTLQTYRRETRGPGKKNSPSRKVWIPYPKTLADLDDRERGLGYLHLLCMRSPRE